MLIMTFATKSLSSVPVVATRVAARGFTSIGSLVKALIHRREVLRLGELDERSLKDIGLVRSDLDGALAVSWLADPSVILAQRSSARSGVAAARRETGLQQAVTSQQAVRTVIGKPVDMKTVAARSSRSLAVPAQASNSVACSA